MPSHSVLPLVLANARAGALGEAWRLFREAGLEGERSDPAVLAVRGRLLKEQALGADGAERIALQGQAAEAYGAAGALSGATYHLINAATLWRLAGDTAAARAVAVRVLDSLDRHPDEAETPYWLGATRAEALLLLGRGDAARTALTDAVAAAPQAWEDHAATLRQFRAICEAQGDDAAWLDPLRPPRVLHFAGHMSVTGGDDEGLRVQVREALAAESVGFGFGALAAGADIVVAEALVARGAEVNLILPAVPTVFREASVAREGADWGRRFDALLDTAVSVRTIRGSQAAPGVLEVQLAAEVAMGQAIMRAAALQTEAVQLLILDPDDPGEEAPGGSAWARVFWARGDRRQVIIPAPRAGAGASTIARAGPDARLAALLAIAVEPADFGALSKALAVGPSPATPPVWTGHSFRIAYADPPAAAAAASAVRAALAQRVRIAGAYGVITATAFPGLGEPAPSGPVADQPVALLASTPAGAFHVTGDFAAVLSASGPRRRLEHVGDLEDAPPEAPVEIFAFKA